MFSEEALRRLADPAVQRLVVALSGGLDSMSLLHMAKMADLGKPLLAIHVNHNLQEAAASFESACERFCQRLDVSLRVERVQIKVDGSLEANAREARYEAFEKILQPSDLLLLAHHADDQAETVLFKLLRGSRLPGLQGMPVERTIGRGQLYRPLLTVSRRQLMDYAVQHDISWAEDPTNADLEMDRNYIRHELMPRIESRWPDARERLLTAVARDEQVRDLLRSQLGAVLATVSVEPDVLDLTGLRELEENQLEPLLDAWLVSLNVALPSGGLLGELKRRIVQGESVSITTGDIDFQQHQDQLYLLKTLPDVSSESFSLQEKVLDFRAGTLTNQRVKGSGLAANSKLRVGFRQGGETIRLGRKKSLKNLLQEKQIPRWIRPHLPLVFHGDELVAIPAIPDWGLPMLVADDWQAASDSAGLALEAHLDNRFKPGPG